MNFIIQNVVNIFNLNIEIIIFLFVLSVISYQICIWNEQEQYSKQLNNIQSTDN